jgi:hypothetical protein
MFRSFPLFSLLLLFLLPSLLIAIDKVPNDKRITYYNSGAQFRGGVKKYIPDVGLGFTFSRSSDEKDPNAPVQSAFFVLAQNPQDKKETYLLDVALMYEKKGTKFSIAKKMREKIEGFKKGDREEILPFLCLLSYIIRADFGGKKLKETWTVENIDYDVSINPAKVQKDFGYEVEMSRPKGTLEVKFFLKEKAKGAGNEIWKFRMKSGKISTTFEVSDFDELVTKYKAREYFAPYFE